MEEFEQQSLIDHLAELRGCILVSLAGIAAGFAVSYAFIKDIGQWFFMPIFKVLPERSSLIFTSYQEAFFFI